MSTPVWTTTAGKIASIDEQAAFSVQLEANTSDSTTIAYSLLSGSLPSGMELTSTGLLTGIPAEVYKRTRYTFVVRATAGTQITDRTFYLDVEGADAPVFTTVSGQIQIEDSTRADLYWILDGEEIGYQLQVTDSDTRAGQELQFEIVQGSLPPGVSMSSSGYISGIVQLLPTDPAQTRGGYDNLLGAYDDEVYDYTLNTISVSKNYDFVVRVSDGTSAVEQNNSIFVYSANYWRVSNSEITIDKDNINGIPLTMDQFAQTMDFTAIRRPVFTTGGDLGTFRHDNNVAIAIDVSDFDPLQNDLEYTIQAGSLPTGLSININTGEISGQLAPQSAVETDFEFTIRANRTVNTDDSSVTNVFTDKVFTMKVIGEIDIGIAFTTDTNVGTLHADQPSTLGVVAVAENTNRVLSYTVTAGSLPPGITLSEQGNLLGTIDPEDFLDSTRTFTFTVRVSDQYQDAATSKEFNVTVDIPLTTIRYGNLQGEATSLIDQNIFYNLAQDPSINSTENIYRTEDENFGFKLKPEMLMLSGLEAQTLKIFQQQMDQNHAPKTLYFGDIKTARAVEDGTTKYEVVYLEIKDRLVNNSGSAISSAINVRTDIEQPMLGPRAGSSNLTADANEVNVTTGGGLSFTTSGSKIRFVNPLTSDIDFVSTLFPNAVENMRNRMKSLGHKEYTYLPLWMKSTQIGDLAPLGFVLAVPICYCNPGKSALVKKRIEDKNLDFKKIDFIIDRYLISRSKVTPTKFTADGSTTTFVLDELVHDEDILVKEGDKTVFVGECVKASGFRGKIKPTADFITRSADHEFGIELSHDIPNEKTTITFVKETPANGTIITVNRSDAKYLKFKNKGIF
tara:strand:+ start:3257 stop:5800 length:2544 start_codon:yes stop_codon:yes gene_type:complete